jgi:hypothetical protein
MPLVLDSTYSDTAIKDIADRYDPKIADSAFYPIYSIDIKNTGIESDTFTLRYRRVRNGWLLPVEVKEFVPAGETRTFRTEGPIPDHGVDGLTSDIVYISFFVSTPDSIPIQVMRPEVTLSYGSTQQGDESCGSPGTELKLDITNWK